MMKKAVRSQPRSALTAVTTFSHGGYTEFRLVCFSLPLSVNVSFEFYSENRNCQSQFGFQAGKQLQLMLVWGGHHM